jgi:hypothetical protein
MGAVCLVVGPFTPCRFPEGLRSTRQPTEKIMPRRQLVDLNSHMNTDVIRGSVADFPVSLQPVSRQGPDGPIAIPDRRAVVREDTGQAIAVVSDRYTLVPHARILELVEEAIRPLNVGPTPRGIYVDRRGARMRALYKFPALAEPVLGRDTICPCLQLRNAYDSTSRIVVHIGAFRFVCTNLAVGGGGAFAGGFVSVHAGDIPIEVVMGQLAEYLRGFDRIIRLYRRWLEERPTQEALQNVLDSSLAGRFMPLRAALLEAAPATVFDAYNRLTHHATHSMRSANTAFDMLERINMAFQRTWPVIEGEVASPDQAVSA